MAGAKDRHLTLFCSRANVESETPCGDKRYLLGGDRVVLVADCGTSAYVAYAGKTGVSTGWVRRDELKVTGHDTESLEWIKRAAHPTPTFQISFSPQYDRFLQNHVPVVHAYLGMSKRGSSPSLLSAVNEVIAVAFPKLVDNRYVVLESCRPHSCDEKGLLWVDTQTHTVIGALVHFVYGQSSPDTPLQRFLLIWSADADPEHLPGAFLNELEQWNEGEITLGARIDDALTFRVGAPFVSVRFAGRDGSITAISPTLLRPSAPRIAPANPSGAAKH
ncbi:hypothetical protein [Trinickia fusca]|uniref:hypothetical protein n=1 Tax=Trinickia fusca TaxID=2419777 RepID=UPI001603C0F8|nr:hypothetical protein [Trinickia fusca]